MSNIAVIGSFIVGLVAEIALVLYILFSEELELIIEFNEVGDWAIYDEGSLDFVSQEAVGVGALYSYGS